jgi:hypothetical protein
MKLHLDYKFIKHPYIEESMNSSEKWAIFSLTILDNSNIIIKVVFNLQWDLLVFLQWLSDNKDFILNEKCPLVSNNKSIACIIDEFYESLDEFDNTVDLVYDYRKKHDIRFALRGVDVNNVVIGLNKNIHTISYYDDTENWEFPINLLDFYDEIDAAREQCLSF